MWADNWEQGPYDLCRLPTHPEPAEVEHLHCLSRADAALIKRNMVNGAHYQIKPCTCQKGTRDE